MVRARRNYKLEYQRRRKRASELGFASDWQRRRAPRELKSPKDFALLSDRAREARSRALSVVHRARSERTTIEAAAAELGVPVASVRHWAGDALEPTRRGRTLPREGDRLLRLRPLLLEGESEVSFVPIRGSRAADRADAVFDVQWQYATGQADAAELEQIRGVRVAGRTVESDPVRLGYLARAGAMNTDEVYRELIG
jgi:hypothetical protein